MINILKKTFFYICSLSFIFCISDDSNFGTIEEYNKDDWKHFRYSLFSVYLGSDKYYFFTFNRDKETGVKSIKLLKKVSLSEFYGLNNIDEYEKKIEDRLEKYKKYIHNEYVDINGVIDESKIDGDKEFILYKISQHEKRKDISNNKINIYNAISLAILPMMITIFNSSYFENINFYIKIIWGIMLYFALNILCFIFNFNKVSTYTRSKFSYVKSSDNKKLASLHNLYYEFQAIQDEANLSVSYIKNIDFYVKNIFLILMVITILSFTGLDKKNIDILEVDNKLSYNEFVYLNLDKLEQGDKETLNTVQLINDNIIENKTSKIYIFYKDKYILNTKIFINLKNQFNLYNKKINFVFIQDKNIKNKLDINLILGE